VTIRVRLAPSPTGTLHIGTARTALFNWLYARNKKGKFLIRIEDTDRERSKPEYVESILKGLKWLGLQWDEDLIIQSSRIESHREAIKKLLKKGLAYRCYATETELEEMRELQRLKGHPPRYDNRGRNLSPKDEAKFIEERRSSVIRFRIDESKTIEWHDLIRGHMQWSGQDLGGDMILARRAPSNEIGDPLYNLVVVIDDSYMKISHVIRGEDHISNTAKQILLYEALDLNIPKFAHSPLILNHEGKKLSKRDGVTSIQDFKKMGYTPEAIANYMALLGWSPPEGINERFNIHEASEVFSFDRVNKSGAKFDWDKLNWLNSQVIHELSFESLFKSLNSFWLEAGWEVPDQEWGISLCKLIGPSLITFNDGIEEARPFFQEPIIESEGIKQLEIPDAKKVLALLLKELDNQPWNGQEINHAKEIIQRITELSKIKKGLIMKSLRAAFLGKLQGPDLLETWSLLAKIGKDRERIRRILI
tara:strand:+ start:417 stop:1850 length:1434 start_codon:yes stop_codon:yes gene_type:complete